MACTPQASVGVIGLGFVGGAVCSYLRGRKFQVSGFDLYKQSAPFADAGLADIVFLCLPTQFDPATGMYDTEALMSTCRRLAQVGCRGLVVVKSTVTPGTTEGLARMFPTLRLLHNPEFLSAATALKDFAEQKHIVLGSTSHADEASMGAATTFYTYLFPGAHISRCTSLESESMKIFANSFYATKVQFFNEMYAMCQHTGADYDNVVRMVLKNGWVNPMHTRVPGPDGELSYGGACLPKDSSALLCEMERAGLPCAVLRAAVEERTVMRCSSPAVHNGAPGDPS